MDMKTKVMSSPENIYIYGAIHYSDLVTLPQPPHPSCPEAKSVWQV